MHVITHIIKYIPHNDCPSPWKPQTRPPLSCHRRAAAFCAPPYRCILELEHGLRPPTVWPVLILMLCDINPHVTDGDLPYSISYSSPIRSTSSSHCVGHSNSSLHVGLRCDAGLGRCLAQFQAPKHGRLGKGHCKAVDRIFRDWIAFYNFPKWDIDIKNPYLEVPDEGLIISCLQRPPATEVGPNDTKISTATLWKNFGLLVRLVRDRADSGIPTKVVTSVNNAINIRLVAKGAFQKVRHRPEAGPAVFFDILYYLWALDEHELEHPRCRLQLSVSMSMMFYPGNRPGELWESSAHYGTAEGILYKDLTVHVVRREGELRVAILSKIRNQKFRPEQQKFEWVTGVDAALFCPAWHPIASKCHSWKTKIRRIFALFFRPWHSRSRTMSCGVSRLWMISSG